MRHDSQRKQQMSRRWECRICRVVSRDLSCLVSTLTRRSPGRRMGRRPAPRASARRTVDVRRGGQWQCAVVERAARDRESGPRRGALGWSHRSGASTTRHTTRQTS